MSFLRRTLRMAAIVPWLFAGCTCSGTPETKTIPAVATRPTAAPQAAAPPAAPPTAVVVRDTPAAPPLSADSAAKVSACEKYVAVLSGRKQDPALLDNAELKGLGIQATDLVTCGAVLSDSDVLCTRLIPVEHGPTKMCLHMRAMFHELRAYPQGRSFMLNDVDWEDMRPLRERAPAAMDAFRDALRSADAAKCAQAGDLQSICRAYVNLDKSLCQLQGELAQAEVPVPRRKEGEPATVKAKDVLEDACRETIDSRAFLGQGLKKLAESAPARERELAKAALGQADACAVYAQGAMDLCAGKITTPVPGAGVPATPEPAPTGASAPGAAEISRAPGDLSSAG